MAERFCFDECAYLLLYKSFPSADELKSFRIRIAPSRTLHATLKQALEIMPADAAPMDVLRTTSSFLGLLYPEKGEPPYKLESALAVFEQSLGAFPSAMLYWHHFHMSKRQVDTSSPNPEESVAAHFLRVLHGDD